MWLATVKSFESDDKSRLGKLMSHWLNYQDRIIMIKYISAESGIWNLTQTRQKKLKKKMRQS